jgi:hypothetical protein
MKGMYMADQSQQPKDEKEKKKKRGLWIIWMFAAAIVLMVLTPFLLPAGTSSSSVTPSSGSSATTSTASSDASSTSVDSSVTPSSSEVTSTSSIPTSSEDSSSVPSSEPVDAPRLSQLEDLQAIVLSLKNGNFEYFIWQDTTNLNISVFSGVTLIDTTLLGTKDVNSVNPYWYTSFNDGILFTVSSFLMSPSGIDISETTYFYNALGIEATLTDTNIVPAEGSYADDGIYIAKEVSGQLELHLINGATTDSVKVLDLDDGYISYHLITDVLDATSGQATNLDTMFIVLAVQNGGNFMPAYLAYNSQTLELVHSGLLRDMVTGAITSFTTNGIFVFSPMQQSVNQYTTDGTTTYSNSIGKQMDGFDAYIIEERTFFNGNNTYFYYPGSTMPAIFLGERVYVFENSSEKGLAFATFNEDRTTFKLHAYTDENGLVSSDPYNYSFLTPNSSDDTNGVISYQTNEQDTGNLITHFIRYNNGWEFFEAYGDVDESYDALVMSSNHSYVVDVAEITDSNRDIALISVYDGEANANTVTEIYLLNYDLLSVQILGFAGDYMLLNVYNNTAPRNPIGQGLLIDLTTGIIVDLPESIYYLQPQLNETYTENIYLNGNILTAFKGGNGFSMDVTDIDNTFTTFADNALRDTQVVWIDLVDDHFGVNQDLIFVQTTPFPNNPNGMSSLSLYSGDISLGIDALTLMTTLDVEEDIRNSNNFIVTSDAFYAFSMSENTVTTLWGDVLPNLFYVQNGVIIAISETYEETPTTLLDADRFSY